MINDLNPTALQMELAALLIIISVLIIAISISRKDG